LRQLCIVSANVCLLLISDEIITVKETDVILQESDFKKQHFHWKLESILYTTYSVNCHFDCMLFIP